MQPAATPPPGGKCSSRGRAAIATRSPTQAPRGTIGPNLDAPMPSSELVVDRVTNGAGVMPSFGDTFTEQQINDVAAYVSTVAG